MPKRVNAINVKNAYIPHFKRFEVRFEPCLEQSFDNDQHEL